MSHALAAISEIPTESTQPVQRRAAKPSARAKNSRSASRSQVFYNTHGPHRTLNQAAPLRPLPDSVANLDRLRVRRRDRAGGVIHEYRLVT